MRCLRRWGLNKGLVDSNPIVLAAKCGKIFFHRRISVEVFVDFKVAKDRDRGIA